MYITLNSTEIANSDACRHRLGDRSVTRDLSHGIGTRHTCSTLADYGCVGMRTRWAQMLAIYFLEKPYTIYMEINVCNSRLLKLEQWFYTFPDLSWGINGNATYMEYRQWEKNHVAAPAKASFLNHVRLINHQRAQKSLKAPHLALSSLDPWDQVWALSIFKTCFIFLT